MRQRRRWELSEVLPAEVGEQHRSGLTGRQDQDPRQTVGGGGGAAATKSLLIVTGFSDPCYILEKIKPQSSKFHRIEYNLSKICERPSTSKE